MTRTRMRMVESHSHEDARLPVRRSVCLPLHWPACLTAYHFHADHARACRGRDSKCSRPSARPTSPVSTGTGAPRQHVHPHNYPHTRIPAYLHTRIPSYPHTRIPACTGARIHMCACARAHTYTWVHIRARQCAHAYTQTCTTASPHASTRTWVQGGFCC